MSGINNKQNKIEFLRYQFCIRHLYTNEKRIHLTIMTVNLIIFVLGSIPYLNLMEYFFIVPILWMPINQYMNVLRARYHNKAVNYHEYKDRTMYEMEIPLGMVPRKQTILQDSITLVERKRIKERFIEMSKSSHKITIKDWYNNFSDFNLNLATIMSQDENTKWELRQRELYQWVLYGISFILIIVSLFIIQVNSFEAVTLLYVVPFVLAIGNDIFDNKNVISELEICRDNIGDVYSSVRNGDSTTAFIDETKEIIQMRLFLIRKDSNSVPDFIYKIFRKKLQHESNQYFDSLIQELKEACSQ